MYSGETNAKIQVGETRVQGVPGGQSVPQGGREPTVAAQRVSLGGEERHTA